MAHLRAIHPSPIGYSAGLARTIILPGIRAVSRTFEGTRLLKGETGSRPITSTAVNLMLAALFVCIGESGARGLTIAPRMLGLLILALVGIALWAGSRFFSKLNKP